MFSLPRMGSPPARVASVFVASRGLVWVVGVIAFATLGLSSEQASGLHGVGDLLTAPALRFDSGWYLRIAEHGYALNRVSAAFFPLYPLLLRLLGTVIGSLAAAGILISLAGFAAGLLLLQRLATIELGSDAATRTLYLVAFSHRAVLLRGLYGGVVPWAVRGAVYAARRSWWGWAAVCAALAAATRNTGVLLLVPLAMMYLYGPRSDRPPDRSIARFRPRYKLRVDATWLLAAPTGLLVYMAYDWLHFGDALLSWHAQTHWHRYFHGPLAAIAFAARNASRALGAHIVGSGSTMMATGDLVAFGVLVFAVVAVTGALRTLPAAYGAYALVALIPSLSVFWAAHPLTSLARFLAVLFPLHMWMASRTRTCRSVCRSAAASGLMMIYVTVRFATGHWAG